tara:strand:- start:8032 stop:9333 length:1302 start_codon:yes stop_codon:yes gene_type:complete
MHDIKNLKITSNCNEEEIRFKSFELINKRKPYVLEQTFGLDASNKRINNGNFEAFPEDSVEHDLIEFVKSGDPMILISKGLWITENPGKDEISRNITFFQASTNTTYTVGGIGLIRLDKDMLYLEDPIFETSFHKYQLKRGNNEGGTTYFTEKGKVNKNNATPVGVSYYEQGPYNLVEKIEKTEALKEKGFNTPQYIAAGRIKNLLKGEFGFSIYKTQLTHDYLLNLGLYLDKKGNFKTNFFQYIESKYQQLAKLHFHLKLTHGQPTVTNAEGEINLENGTYQLRCVIKDLATLKAIPDQIQKLITEGPTPYKINATVKKSPKVAAIVNDLQIALTQEFNILLIAMSTLPNDDIKFKFIQYQYPIVMRSIAKAYDLLEDSSIEQLINFSLNHFINSLKLGHSISLCHEILGGLSAHAMLGLSAEFQNEIEFIN